MTYELFTADAVKWQYIYSLPNNFDVLSVKKWSGNIDYEIITQFDWKLLKLIDTPNRKFKIKLLCSIS